MDIGVTHDRVRAGHYLVRSHAVQHALKQGFEPRHMVDAVPGGMVIEADPDDQRSLVCGQATPVGSATVYLHVVCEYADPVYVEFVTAYVPDEAQREIPPFRRRKRRR